MRIKEDKPKKKKMIKKPKRKKCTKFKSMALSGFELTPFESAIIED